MDILSSLKKACLCDMHNIISDVVMQRATVGMLLALLLGYMLVREREGTFMTLYYLIINNAVWHAPENNLTGNIWQFNLEQKLEKILIKIITTCPSGQLVDDNSCEIIGIDTGTMPRGALPQEAGMN